MTKLNRWRLAIVEWRTFSASSYDGVANPLPHRLIFPHSVRHSNTVIVMDRIIWHPSVIFLTDFILVIVTVIVNDFLF